MNSPNETRTDLPTIEAESQAFWDAANHGQLMLAKCKSCGRLHYYPRPMCPHCWSHDVGLTPASGRGVVYTYSTVFVNDLPPFKSRLPYIAASVELAEGLRITTNIVGCSPEQVRIGLPVTVRFEVIAANVAIPVFEPDGIDSAGAGPDRGVVLQ
jgi:uncharacterized protein